MYEADTGAPEPTDEHRRLLAEAVINAFGEGSQAEFLGVRVKGVRGDEGFYGWAVTLKLPDAVVDDIRSNGWDHFENDLRPPFNDAIYSAPLYDVVGNVTVEILFEPDRDT